MNNIIESPHFALYHALKNAPRTLREHPVISQHTAASTAIHFVRYALFAGFLATYHYFNEHRFTRAGITLIMGIHATYTLTEGTLQNLFSVLAIDREYSTRTSIPQESKEHESLNTDGAMINTAGLATHYILGQATLWVMSVTLNAILPEGSIKTLANYGFNALVMYWNGLQFFQYPLAYKGLSSKDQMHTLTQNTSRCFVLGAALFCISHSLDIIPLPLAPFSTALKSMIPIIGVTLAHEMDIKPVRLTPTTHPDGEYELVNASHLDRRNPASLLWLGSNALLVRAQQIIRRFGQHKNPFIAQLIRLKNALSHIQCLNTAGHFLFHAAVKIAHRTKPLTRHIAILLLSTPAVQPIVSDALATANTIIEQTEDKKTTLWLAQVLLKHDPSGAAQRKVKKKLQEALGLSEKLADKLLQFAISLDLEKLIKKTKKVQGFLKKAKSPTKVRQTERDWVDVTRPKDDGDLDWDDCDVLVDPKATTKMVYDEITWPEWGAMVFVYTGIPAAIASLETLLDTPETTEPAAHSEGAPSPRDTARQTPAPEGTPTRRRRHPRS